MPQELHVVRCYSCEIFQVDIVKKVKTWTCKMCGAKQSLKKVYATGSGKECREFVQNLNQQHLTLQQSAAKDEVAHVIDPPDTILERNEADDNSCDSKWSKFVPDNSKNETSDLCNVYSNMKGNEFITNKSITTTYEYTDKDKEAHTIQANNTKDKTHQLNKPTDAEFTAETENSKNICDYKHKSSKWERYLSINEECSNDSILENDDADNAKNLSKFQSRTVSGFKNKFGDTSDINVDLEL